MSEQEIADLIVAQVITPELVFSVFNEIMARRNFSKEYVEFKIQEARDYEIASNYNCW
jgi:hypothetical protein